jgi:hypothetical protein
LEKGVPLHLKKLESPLPRDDLHQAWLNLAQWFWLEKMFKWTHPISTFLWLSPLWTRPGPLFEQTWIPFTQIYLCQVWIWHAGSGEGFFFFFFF